MEFFQKNKKIILFVGIFLFVVLIYQIFFTGSSTESPKSAYSPTKSGLVSEVSASPADAIVGRELLVVLAQLRSISLDPSIFSSPVFMSLEDLSHPIEPQPLGKSVGRRNPFSDFSSGSASQSGTNSASGIQSSSVGGTVR